MIYLLGVGNVRTAPELAGCKQPEYSGNATFFVQLPWKSFSVKCIKTTVSMNVHELYAVS